MKAVLMLLMLAAPSALACKCQVEVSVCPGVAMSDLVFSGTVISVAPRYLDPWHANEEAAKAPVGEILRLQADSSAESLTQLKAVYLKMFAGLPEDVAEEVHGASTRRELDALVNHIASQGTVTRFRVRTIYHRGDDDDDPAGKDKASDDDGDDEKTLDVWTPADDCGVAFLPGETYLVFADTDEDTGRLETSICTRTKRLSDAGADLAYLYFLKDDEENSGRIEGFVSTDPNLNRSAMVDSVKAPAPNLVVQLKSKKVGPLYTRSAMDGRFIFDGLDDGAYELSVYDTEFPKRVRLLSGPRTIQLGEKGCANPLITVLALIPEKPD